MSNKDTSSFFSFSGRIRRKTYGLRVLGVALPCALVNGLLQGSGDPGAAAFGTLVMVSGSLALLPSAVQRLHDFDRSGHWMWASPIPVLGLLLGLTLLFASGSDGRNTYGPNPRQPERTPARGRASSKLPKETREEERVSTVHGFSDRVSPGKKRRTTKAKSGNGAEPTSPHDRIGNGSEEAEVEEVVGEETGDPIKEKHPLQKKSRGDEASLPPPKAQSAPRLMYDPSRVKSSREHYPKCIMPWPGAQVQEPRVGQRSARKGHKEADFGRHLRRHFGEHLEVRTDCVMAVAEGTRPYEPDFVLCDPAHNLFVDVEIDEPYSGGPSRRPIHCEGDDDQRDDFFACRGWIVARFPEILVHERPDGCCKLLAVFLAKLCPNAFSMSPVLSDVQDIYRVEQWDELQAQQWAKEGYREDYLGIDSFGENETEPPTIIEELTERERQVARQAEDANSTSGGDGQTRIPASQGDGVSKLVGALSEPEGKQKHRTHPRDTQITFDSEEHRYFINGNPNTISVTTLIDRCFPVFDKKGVAAKVARKKSSRYYGMDVGEIVAGWEEKGNRAAEQGKRLHELIENRLNEKPVRPEGYEREFSYFRRFIRDHSELRPYRTEWRIYDEYLMVAGTLDALFERPDGTLVMYDWKRTEKMKKENRWESGLGALSHLPNAKYHRYALQQNIYREILRRRYDLEVEEMNLLVLHPSNDSYERHTVDFMGEEASLAMEQ